jgi:hypothetical protein
VAGVGPVLRAGEIAKAVIAAIREKNREVIILERSGYVRVSVAARCVLHREDVEKHLAQSFVLPRDLELVMPSFSGRIKVNADMAVWESWGES